MVFGEDCIVKRGNFIEDTFSHRAMASMRQDLRLWATTFRMHTLLVGGSDTVVVRHMRGAVRTDMGGPQASVSPSDSAAGLLQRFDALTLDRTGIFEDFQGNSLPF